MKCLIYSSCMYVCLYVIETNAIATPYVQNDWEVWRHDKFQCPLFLFLVALVSGWFFPMVRASVREKDEEKFRDTAKKEKRRGRGALRRTHSRSRGCRNWGGWASLSQEKSTREREREVSSSIVESRGEFRVGATSGVEGATLRRLPSCDGVAAVCVLTKYLRAREKGRGRQGMKRTPLPRRLW